MYYGESILDCWEDTGSYWDCWLERAKELFPSDYDPVLKLDLTWGIGAVQNALLALYLQENPSELSKVNNTIRSLKAILDSNDYLIWERLSFVPSATSMEIRSIAGRDYGMDWKTWLTIQTRSFYLMMGFSNVREFFAWCSMITMWCYGLTRDPLFLTKSQQFIEKFINPPSSIPKKLLNTPASTNKEVMAKFSDDVYEVVAEIYNADLRPFLFDTRLENIRAFVESEFAMTQDTIELAVENRGLRKEERFDFVKFGIGFFGAIAILKIAID